MGMKKFIYGFFGERAGRLIIVTWNWLWGISEPSQQEQAVSTAEASLREMQNSVEKLTQAVTVQVNNYQQAEERYSAKVREFKDLETKAQTLKAQGNTEAARLTMIQAIQLEKILPQLKENVENAEKFVQAAKEQLTRQKEKLETYKSELANMQAVQEVNQALAQMAEVNNNYNIDSAKSQFEAAKEAVNDRQAEVQALYEMSKSPTEGLEEQMDNMTLEDEVSRRLEGFGNGESQQRKS
ncbi:MAG: PspA/IM30 family protein [Halothece sp. Uz-M2-17]|nr:PspA/IM30 family protein [Halothece sp. Uz-M2-17]